MNEIGYQKLNQIKKKFHFTNLQNVFCKAFVASNVMTILFPFHSNLVEVQVIQHYIQVFFWNFLSSNATLFPNYSGNDIFIHSRWCMIKIIFETWLCRHQESKVMVIACYDMKMTIDIPIQNYVINLSKIMSAKSSQTTDIIQKW